MEKQIRLELLKKQLERLKTRVIKLEKLSNTYTWARLIIFTVGFVFTVLGFSIFGKTSGFLILSLSIIFFLTAVFFHARLEASLKKFKLVHQLKDDQINRLNLEWSKLREPLIKKTFSNHPFAYDIDIIGKNSLFQLIDNTVSEEGEELLLDWLTERNPEIETILKRQAIIKELVPLTLFRDKLLLNTYLVTHNPFQKWQGKRILKWMENDNTFDELKKVLKISSILLISSYLLYIISLMGINTWLWKITYVLYAAYFFMNDQHVKAFFRESIDIEFELRRLNSVFYKLEKFDFGKNINLQAFCQEFKKEETKPSLYMKRIKNLVASASVQNNPAVWLLTNAIFPWDFFHGYRLKKYKSQIAKIMPNWLNSWFELEAMISLANFSYLNPEYIFPEISSEKKDFVFKAKSMGHPLLPIGKKVCNDFTLNKPGEIIIITGSNMAGKSTFLRTLGINLSLAFAGGPVNAEEFNTFLFRLFTCIRVNDSVTDGLSYFYAEVKRLKALLEELKTPNELPLFFLIDEIFRGTNNRERLTGSRSYINALTGHHGIGAISTHDLELVKLADTSREITNYHFKDDITDDKMVFDYKIHQGPCPTTNALKIMEIEGLPVNYAEQN